MSKKASHHSASGKNLYAIRDRRSRFKDIHTYKIAHSQDMKRKNKKEVI